MITHKRLLEILSYDQLTGTFTWLIDIGYKKKNTKAGNTPSFGYITIHIEKKNYYAHRLAWFYIHKTWPTQIIDHKNRNRQDNRLNNLRDISTADNNKNKSKQLKIINGHIIINQTV